MPVEVPATEWRVARVHGLEVRWRHQLRCRSPPADGELDCRGFWDKGKTDKDALWTSNAEIAPTLRAYVDAVGANFGRVRIDQARAAGPRDGDPILHRDDNNRFNPDDEGWVVRSWVELTDNPDSYMLLMDNGADGLPDPATERRVPLAPGRSVRRRHAASVARRRPQRRRAPLRADHQLRVRPRARRLDRPSSPRRRRHRYTRCLTPGVTSVTLRHAAGACLRCSIGVTPSRSAMSRMIVASSKSFGV